MFGDVRAVSSVELPLVVGGGAPDVALFVLLRALLARDALGGHWAGEQPFETDGLSAILALVDRAVLEAVDGAGDLVQELLFAIAQPERRREQLLRGRLIDGVPDRCRSSRSMLMWRLFWALCSSRLRASVRTRLSSSV